MFNLYKITNKVNNKKYIGYTSKTIEERWKSHIKDCKFSIDRLFYKAINKYGSDNFCIELIETVPTREEAIKREIELIAKFKTYAFGENGYGYNSTLGGDGGNGRVFSEDERTKVSKRQKKLGRWDKSGNPNFNGALFAKIGHPRLNTVHSEESKERIRESKKGHSEGLKNPSVVKEVTYAKHIKTGIIYRKDSFYEMRKFLESEFGIKVNRSTALSVIRGMGKSHKGFVFYRKDETDSETFNRIDNEYKLGIANPIEINDGRIGIKHHNSKNIKCFARKVSDGSLHMFESWYDLKQFFNNSVDVKTTYSELKNCLTGKKKTARGYTVYREDLTDPILFENLLTEYKNFNDYPIGSLEQQE